MNNPNFAHSLCKRSVKRWLARASEDSSDSSVLAQFKGKAQLYSDLLFERVARFCRNKSSRAVGNLHSQLLKPELPSLLPRIFFLSMSWCAETCSLHNREQKSNTLIPDNEFLSEDHEFIIIKRISTEACLDSSSQNETLFEFEYQLLQGKIPLLSYYSNQLSYS
jgi:hypothetical protein